MTAIDSTVREFSIAFYPPNTFGAIFFFAALATTLAAGTWLGMRFYLHKYGVMTEGTVTESSVKSERIGSSGFSTSSRLHTHRLTIEFTAPDGVKRTVKGRHYSSEGDKESRDNLQVGGKVPVVYSRTNPDNAMYYDHVWHYITPVALLVVGLLFTYMAAGLCYKDIRTANNLSLIELRNERPDGNRDAVIEYDQAIYHDPNDAAAYERRGDAQFSDTRFSDAIADYSEALRLLPDRRELLLKRAKAEWLDGRDYDALRDWLKSR